MSDDSNVIRSIDWRSVFPFTLIFKSFRIAIHPSKLVLALLALLLIYGGGRVLDYIWPNDYRAIPNEVGLFEQSRLAPDPSKLYHDTRNGIRTRAGGIYKEELRRIGKEGGSLKDITWRIFDDRNNAVKIVRDEFEKTNKTDEDKKARDAKIAKLYADASGQAEMYYRSYRYYGLFETFYEYEVSQVNQVVAGVRNGDWLGETGVTQAIVRFFAIGPQWAARHHTVYFIVFGLYFLAIWSIFGGAIARIAAVHIARDEKLSVRQALSFSVSKFLSFLSAPIIPMGIVVAVGVLVAVGGLLGNIPWIGAPIVGGLFFLALAAGFVMSLVLLGTAGGFNLMYPTIAVEGSDSFDAISRSFSYLYARPWRLAFYTTVAIAYGALCYLFIRFFIYILLSLTHYFAGLWMYSSADSTNYLWSSMWPSPYVNGRLTYNIDFSSLGGMQSAGAFLLAIWIYLTIAMLGAFAISFYFSANTIIYYLMRQEVDATEQDDVFLEQAEDDFGDPTPAAATRQPAASPTSNPEPARDPLPPVEENPPPST